MCGGDGATCDICHRQVAWACPQAQQASIRADNALTRALPINKCKVSPTRRYSAASVAILLGALSYTTTSTYMESRGERELCAQGKHTRPNQITTFRFRLGLLAISFRKDQPSYKHVKGDGRFVTTHNRTNKTTTLFGIYYFFSIVFAS